MFELMDLLTGGFGIFLLVCYFFITSIFTSWLAAGKGYNGGAWFVLGLFFGILALLTIGLAPDNKINELVSKLDDIKRSLNIQSPENNTLTKPSMANATINSYNDEFWTCKKCATKNPLVSNSCSDCGEYK